MEFKPNESIIRLCKVLSVINDENDCRDFLEDACTINELEDIAQRLDVAIMLDSGKNYKEINEKTGASTATISRVNRCYRYGNGYKVALAALKKETK